VTLQLQLRFVLHSLNDSGMKRREAHSVDLRTSKSSAMGAFRTLQRALLLLLL